MAIIYSYPTVQPTRTDLILGTDVSVKGKPTKNFTVQSIIDLVTVATGDLQTVLDLGFVAVGKDINLTNNTFKGAGFQTQDNQTPANVLVNITGQVGTGFTDFTSTRITGTLQTPAQTNITSLGTLLDLKVGNATPAITSIVTSITTPGDNIKLATTKAIVDYIGSQPSPENLFKTLQAGNTAYSGTVGFDINMGITGTSNGNILFGNNKKIRIGDFGVTYPLEMFYGGDPGPSTNVVAILQNKAGGVTGNVPLTLRSNILDLSSVGSVNPSVNPEKYLTATKYVDAASTGVILYYNDTKKFETLAVGAKTTGAFEATGSGTFVNLLNSGTYQDSSGDVGTAGQILSSTATGTNWIADPNPTPYSWLIEADSGTGNPYTVANGNTIHFVGIGNVNTEWDDTNKELEISLAGTSVSGSGVAGRATYWTGNQTISSSSAYLFDATNSRLLVHDTSDVNKGIIWADNFTTDGSSYPISATAPKWTGSIMTNMTAITSTLFTGDLAGNASTATQLASAGTITTSGDVSLTGGPYNYTQGGNMALATNIADSVIMGKVLTGYTAGTAGAIADTDTILAAFEKLQASITATTGLSYEGAWTPGTDATAGGTPDLRLTGAKVNGAFYICDADGTGTPNGDGTTPNSWKTGDWVIYVANGSATDEWQKLDQSNEVLGSGSPNQYTMWSGTNTIGTGVISQNTDATKTVTIGNSANLVVEGSTTLGDANTDTTTFKGPGTFEQTARLKTGLALGTATDGTEYGTAGYALTSGGASGNPNTWTALEVGTVTSVTGLYGITVGGTTAVPTVAVTTDTNNLINQATVKATPVGADTILINDSASTPANVLKKATLTSIKTFTAESWILSDGTNTTTISDNDTAKFIAAGTGIAVAENNGTITITGSANPGTGTALTLPVWDTTTSLGDSMVKQDAASGTTLTISGLEPSVVIDDTTTGKGSLTISRAADATTYMSSGISTSGSETYGTHVFSQTDGTTPRAILELENDRKARFYGGVGINTRNSTIDTPLVINTIAGYPDIATFSSGDSTDANEDCRIVMNAKGTGTAVISTNSSIDLQKQGSSKLLVSSTGASVTGTLSTTTSASIGTTLTTGGSITVATHGLLSIISTNNLTISGTAVDHAGLSFATQAILPVTVSVENNGVVDLGANGAQFKDLYLSGNVIHGGSGTGTKGGIFNKLYTTGDAGVAEVAFTIDRASSGSMVFDVMLTSDNSNSVSIAKKFTVASRLGTQAPIFNKTIDTGPDGSNDFTAVFAADGTSTTKIKCTITPAGMNTQKIGITIDLGFGQNDATVVMN